MNMDEINAPDLSEIEALKILKPADMAEIMGCTKVTIWRMEKRGELPPRKKFNPRVTGWTTQEIRDWMESRPAALGNGGQ